MQRQPWTSCLFCQIHLFALPTYLVDIWRTSQPKLKEPGEQVGLGLQEFTARETVRLGLASTSKLISLCRNPSFVGPRVLIFLLLLDLHLSAETVTINFCGVLIVWWGREENWHAHVEFPSSDVLVSGFLVVSAHFHVSFN